MRLSRLFFKTFKEAPAEAEIPSHKLLERAGYIRRLGRGLYSFTPLMQRVLSKLIAIIDEELQQAGAQRVALPHLQPRELWEQSGRWAGYIAEQLLYTLTDRDTHEMCLGPTHEEAITALIHNWITSYRQLPVNLYQITAKFRDEIRPRFGLMRSKEFLMKDGYAFCANPDSMEEQYQLMRAAYIRIFKRLELKFAVVHAQGGKIGQGKSEEFQVLAEIGEDEILTSGEHGFNVEAATSIPPAYAYSSNLKPLQLLPTPGMKTIEQLIAFTKHPVQELLKTVIYKLTFSDHEKFIAIGIRGDRQINEAKVAAFFNPLELALASDEEIMRIAGCQPGFLGPINLAIPYFADLSCAPMTNFICGANENEMHIAHVNWERDCPKPEFHDFLLAQAGDICPTAGQNAIYSSQRGIEVGHIFNLGTKYSVALNATYQDEAGVQHPFWMGCYGIGVSRVIQASVEQKYDEKGIVWPVAIAPYHVVITAAAQNDPIQTKVAEEIYTDFCKRGIEVLFDDRDERLGFKLKDSDLMGIPYKIIVGKRYHENQLIEIEPRTGEKALVTRDSLSGWFPNK